MLYALLYTHSLYFVTSSSLTARISAHLQTQFSHWINFRWATHVTLPEASLVLRAGLEKNIVRMKLSLAVLSLLSSRVSSMNTIITWSGRTRKWVWILSLKHFYDWVHAFTESMDRGPMVRWVFFNECAKNLVCYICQVWNARDPKVSITWFNGTILARSFFIDSNFEYRCMMVKGLYFHSASEMTKSSDRTKSASQVRSQWLSCSPLLKLQNVFLSAINSATLSEHSLNWWELSLYLYFCEEMSENWNWCLKNQDRPQFQSPCSLRAHNIIDIFSMLNGTTAVHKKTCKKRDCDTSLSVTRMNMNWYRTLKLESEIGGQLDIFRPIPSCPAVGWNAKIKK